MVFSVLHPKSRPKPPKKSEAPPPPPPAVKEAPPPPPAEEPPKPPTPQPQPPPQHSHFLPPYAEELGRMERLRSIEYTNARTWRMNFGDHPNNYFDHYGNYEYSRYPVRVRGGGGHDYLDNHQMLQAAPPCMSLPPPDYHHGLPGPPPRLGLPPPDYNHGPQPRHTLSLLDHRHGPPPPPDYHYGPPPAAYYYPPPPPYGGFFSDENPNGCLIM